MNESKVSFRIAVQQWETDGPLEGLYRLFKEYAGAADEIAFFSDETHPPVPLEVFRPRMDRLKEIMPRFRDLGMTAGINVLATIGHLEENLDNSLSEPWQKLMAPDGAVCRGCYCPSDENMQAYITAIYESAALANPDFIWIDDDVRLYGHDPVLCGCFCDKCLAIFSSETGQDWTRDKLLAVLNSDSLGEKLDFRRKWLQHNRQLINGIMSIVEKAAHGINENLPLGFMTGDRFYEGYDFARWADTLNGPQNAPVMWRPGEGFYEDKIPSDLVKKADAIGRQASMLPDYVTDIQSEIENFPYHRLKKSFHITVLEAATDLAAGSTGTAFNILSMFDEPLDEYAPFLDRIRTARPFYDLVVSTFQRSHCEGLWSAWNKDVFVTEGLESGWFENRGEFYKSGEVQSEFFEIGIPRAYSREGAEVTAFTGNTPLAFDKEGIKEIMAGGVIMDVPALECLREMGMGEYTGFEQAGQREDDSIEVLTDHPLNGDFSARKRDCRQAFKWWSETAYLIKPVSEDAQVLTNLVDYGGKHYGATMGTFENTLGGRVAVCGYFPWRYIHNLSKSSQVKSVLKWLSTDTLPAYVESFEKVNIWCRKTPAGGNGIFLLNSSFDVIEDLKIHVLTDKDELSVFDMDCREEKSARCGDSGDYGEFKIKNLKPWTAVLVR